MGLLVILAKHGLLEVWRFLHLAVPSAGALDNVRRWKSLIRQGGAPDRPRLWARRKAVELSANPIHGSPSSHLCRLGAGLGHSVPRPMIPEPTLVAAQRDKERLLARHVGRCWLRVPLGSARRIFAGQDVHVNVVLDAELNRLVSRWFGDGDAGGAAPLFDELPRRTELLVLELARGGGDALRLVAHANRLCAIAQREAAVANGPLARVVRGGPPGARHRRPDEIVLEKGVDARAGGRAHDRIGLKDEHFLADDRLPEHRDGVACGVVGEEIGELGPVGRASKDLDVPAARVVVHVVDDESLQLGPPRGVDHHCHDRQQRRRRLGQLERREIVDVLVAQLLAPQQRAVAPASGTHHELTTGTEKKQALSA
eukprot:6212433-Pleurochrysis_carterae.AAC.2